MIAHFFTGPLFAVLTRERHGTIAGAVVHVPGIPELVSPEIQSLPKGPSWYTPAWNARP